MQRSSPSSHCSPLPITLSATMVIWVPVSRKHGAYPHRNLFPHYMHHPALTIYFRCIFRYAPIFWFGTLCCNFKDVSCQNWLLLLQYVVTPSVLKIGFIWIRNFFLISLKYCPFPRYGYLKPKIDSFVNFDKP